MLEKSTKPFLRMFTNTVNMDIYILYVEWPCLVILILKCVNFHYFCHEVIVHFFLFSFDLVKVEFAEKENREWKGKHNEDSVHQPTCVTHGHAELSGKHEDL